MKEAGFQSNQPSRRVATRPNSPTIWPDPGSIDRHGNLGARTQGRTVDRIVKRYAKAAKLEDAPTFGAHSLRAGFITSAAEAGKPVDRIMDHTGHKSHAMIRLYTRREDAWKDNAGSGLL